MKWMFSLISFCVLIQMDVASTDSTDHVWKVHGHLPCRSTWSGASLSRASFCGTCPRKWIVQYSVRMSQGETTESATYFSSKWSFHWGESLSKVKQEPNYLSNIYCSLKLVNIFGLFVNFLIFQGFVLWNFCWWIWESEAEELWYYCVYWNRLNIMVLQH